MQAVSSILIPCARVRRRAAMAAGIAGLCGLALFVAAAPGLDPKAPALQDLKQAYAKEKQQVAADHVSRLKALAQQSLGQFKATLLEKKKSGNISGIATAQKGVSIFEEGLKELDEKGTFTPPENVRLELRNALDAFAASRKKIDDDHDAALKALDAKFAPRVAEQGKALSGAEISADQIADFFKSLIPTEAAASTNAVPATDGTNQPPAAAGATNAVPAEAEEPPKVIGASSTAGSTNWVVVGRWFASVANIEIVNVPLIGRDQEAHATTEGTVIGQSYETRYEPVRVLTPGPEYRFMLKTLKGYEAPSIVAWPSAKNQWTMQVRVRPTQQVPSHHGAEVLVSFPGAEDLAPLHPESGEGEDAAAADSGERVKINVRSTPDGALVLVDGRPLGSGNAYVKTPCTIPVRPGSRNIRLSKFGYKEAVISGFEAIEGRTLTWTFERDPEQVDKTVQVSARTPWQSSGITIRKGDHVTIQIVSGDWVCGSNGERVDAGGYAPSKYYKYYMNPKAGPRQIPAVNYGALIMRVDREGAIHPVSRNMKFKAESEGLLHFDVNEAIDGTARRDNEGSITVRITKVPGTEP